LLRRIVDCTGAFTVRYNNGRALTLVVLCIMTVSSFSIYTHANGTLLPETVEEQIEILFLMDHDYGANYHYIRPILESYGWNVTIAGTAEELTPCDYQNDEEIVIPDVLVWDIQNITEYDAISIMPGESHEILRTDQDVLDLIADAVSAELVVSAWCKAVRVLAAADVIDGKNVTGDGGFIDEYEAAGATYMGVVPPVIDGNIVTGVRSRYYREEMCIAIATALGVYEENPPTISNITISPIVVEPYGTIEVQADVYDETGIEYVYVRFYPYSYEIGARTSNSSIDAERMYDEYENGTYSAEIDISTKNNYTVDFWLVDIFGNEITYYDMAIIEVTNIPTTTTKTESTNTSGSSTMVSSTGSSTSNTIPSSEFPTIIVIVTIAGVTGLLVITVIAIKKRS